MSIAEKILDDVKPPNFISNGKVFLVRCPECKKENWAMAVADGVCVWCGFDGNTLIVPNTKTHNETDSATPKDS